MKTTMRKTNEMQNHATQLWGLRMRVVLVCGVLALLGGCATSSGQMQGPNGRAAFSIKCGHAVMQKCYEEAAKVCPQGYAVVHNQGNPNGMVM